MPEPRKLFSQPRNLGLLDPKRSAQLEAGRFKGGYLTPSGPVQPPQAPSPASPAGAGIAAAAPSMLSRPRPISAFGYAGDGAQRPYNPPQQTERVNPLTGDNPAQPPGTTSIVSRPPFIQRGAGVPRGQDVAAPIPTQDDTVNGSMQGTYDRLRGRTPVSGGTGAFSRQFTNPNSAGQYAAFARRLFS